MARYALMAMPTHPSPGRQTESTFPLTVREGSPRDDSVGILNEPATVLYAPTQKNGGGTQCNAGNAMGRDSRSRPARAARSPALPSICFRCNRPGHIARQCDEPIAPSQSDDHPGNLYARVMVSDSANENGLPYARPSTRRN
ncbi:hypothetical protein MTO96_049801 [Rhipicephalus appendiculatus]